MLCLWPWFYITVGNEEKQNTKEILGFFGTQVYLQSINGAAVLPIINSL